MVIGIGADNDRAARMWRMGCSSGLMSLGGSSIWQSCTHCVSVGGKSSIKGGLVDATDYVSRVFHEMMRLQEY